METLLNSGVSVIMITGDMERTAVSVAHRVSIFDPEQHATLSGAEVDRMSDEQLQTATRNVTVFYRTSPEHKLRIVKALQADGSVVAMTGDGVNDALSLKMANIGIAMGMTGTDVAKEASDMILTDDDFSTILVRLQATGQCHWGNACIDRCGTTVAVAPSSSHPPDTTHIAERN